MNETILQLLKQKVGENDDDLQKQINLINQNLRRFGWKAPNLVHLKAGFARCHLKTSSCYNGCGRNLTPEQVIGVRFFKWTEMPKINDSTDKEIRFFNFFVLCIDCSYEKKNIPQAPRTVQEAIAFQTGKTDEGIQSELARKLVAQNLEKKKRELEQAKKETEKVVQEIAYKKDEFDDLSNDLKIMEKRLAKKKEKTMSKLSKIEQEKNKLEIEGPKLDQELAELEDKYNQKVTENTRIRTEIAKIEAEKNKAAIERLATIGDICRNLQEKQGSQMKGLLNSFEFKMKEVEAHAMQTLRDFQSQMAVTLKDCEGSMSKSRKLIDRSLGNLIDMSEETSTKLDGEKKCAVCFNSIRDYMVIKPCNHVFCGGCLQKLDRCPLDREWITGKDRLLFPM